mgnify:CR=1 FL=1
MTPGEFGSNSSVLFYPRKALPDGYYPVTKSGAIVFTFKMLFCKQFRTKRTAVYFHGNGEIVEVYFSLTFLTVLISCL